MPSYKAFKISTAAIVFIVMAAFLSHAAVPTYQDILGTNGVTNRVVGSLGSQKVMVSGERLQPGSANLTNWSLLPTNVVNGSATNAVSAIDTNGTAVISAGATKINFISATGMVSGTTAIIGFPFDTSALTALIYTIGDNDTNYINSRAVALSNLSYAIGTAGTNFSLSSSSSLYSALSLISSNNVRVAAGTGGITINASGAGGVMTYTVNDDDAGGGGTAFAAEQFETNGGVIWIKRLAALTNISVTLQTNRNDIHFSGGGKQIRWQGGPYFEDTGGSFEHLAVVTPTGEFQVTGDARFGGAGAGVVYPVDRFVRLGTATAPWATGRVDVIYATNINIGGDTVGHLAMSNVAPSTVAVFDADRRLTNSSVASANLGYLSDESWTNLIGNPNVATNLLGAGTVTVTSNNLGGWTITGAASGGDAGGTNSRQFGSAPLTNLSGNVNVATNILGAGTVTVTSNNAGTFTITGSGGSGGVATNANQFAANTTLTIKEFALLTNTTARGLTNLGHTDILSLTVNDTAEFNDSATFDSTAFFNAGIVQTPRAMTPLSAGVGLANAALGNYFTNIATVTTNLLVTNILVGQTLQLDLKSAPGVTVTLNQFPIGSYLGINTNGGSIPAIATNGTTRVHITRLDSTTTNIQVFPPLFSVAFAGADTNFATGVITPATGGDAGGTNSRQFGSASLTNLSGNPNVATNISGAGSVTVTSNNIGGWTITGADSGSGQPASTTLTNMVPNDTNWLVFSAAARADTNNLGTDYQKWSFGSGTNNAQFIYYHTNNFLYVGTQVSPAKFIKLNASDLTVVDGISFSGDGFHGLARDIFYAQSKNRLVVMFQNSSYLSVSEVNPDTMAVTDVVTEDTDVNDHVSFTTDQTNVWVYGFDSVAGVNGSMLTQFRLSDWTKLNYLVLTNLASSQNGPIRYDTNTGRLFWINGTNGMMRGYSAPASNMSNYISTISTRVPFAQLGTELVFAGDYAYGFTDQGTISGSVYRMHKSTLEIEQIKIGSSNSITGGFYDGRHLWLVGFTNTNFKSIIARLDPINLKIDRVLLPDTNIVFKITGDGTNRIFTAGRSSPGQVMRLQAPIVASPSQKVRWSDLLDVPQLANVTVNTFSGGYVSGITNIGYTTTNVFIDLGQTNYAVWCVTNTSGPVNLLLTNLNLVGFNFTVLIDGENIDGGTTASNMPVTYVWPHASVTAHWLGSQTNDWVTTNKVLGIAGLIRRTNSVVISSRE